MEKVVPAIDDLAKDTNQNVRASLASVIMSLSPTLGKDKTMNILLPFFLQLLRDPCAEVMKSRKDQCERFETFAEVFLSFVWKSIASGKGFGQLMRFGIPLF